MPNVTISGSSYFSYASIAASDTYLAADPLLSAVWSPLSPDPAKGQYLVGSTRELDRVPWPGTKTDPDQDNAFPRTGISGVDPDDDAPVWLVNATIELAGAKANGYDSANQQFTDPVAKRLRAGSVEIEYFTASIGGQPLRFPLPVWELIKPYLGGSGVVGVESFGTHGRSSFCPDFGLAGPL